MYKRANKISGGQAQRVAIARGLINKPSIVLADEPTGNLDSVTSDTIVQLMKSMAKKLNQTFIIVTHEREIFGNVDRIITIKMAEPFEDDQPIRNGGFSIMNLKLLLSLSVIGLAPFIFDNSYAQITSGGFGHSPFERDFGDVKFLDAYFGTLNKKIEIESGRP